LILVRACARPLFLAGGAFLRGAAAHAPHL
jgi:hypothetical protein